MFGKGFAVVATGEGLRMLRSGLRQVVGIHIAEAGDFHLGVTGHLLAVKATDGADHADGQNSELAIRRGGARPRPPQGGEAEACCGGGVEEVAATQSGFHMGER